MTLYPLSSEAKDLLGESLDLTLRPRVSDRVRVLVHAFEFLSRNHGSHVSGVGRVIHEADLKSLVKELKNLT